MATRLSYACPKCHRTYKTDHGMITHLKKEHKLDGYQLLLFAVFDTQ